MQKPVSFVALIGTPCGVRSKYASVGLFGLPRCRDFFKGFLQCVLAIIFISTSLFSASVLPLRLKQITQTAAMIFVGRCVDFSHELDQNGFPSRWIRYEVEKGIKGVRDHEDFWVKQFDFQKRVVCSGNRVLFLYPESGAGFTSPVGLGQGEFTIEVDETGEKRVRSPYPHLSEEIGEIDLESFLGKIRRWVVP